MPNRLADATSPYLQQHADNPVDWYPWGEEALARAQREGRPILLSIGYAACHWCHVMAHESFEDETTAQVMNERFVNIKVDREERPDLDAIYMQAVQAMTGHGGWPMTVFLTPEGVPFYGGTYFPPEDRQGMPSFRRVLDAIATAYRERPDDIARTVDQMKQLYAAMSEGARSTGTLNATLLERAYRGLAQQYDVRHGGFGAAPKFPQAMALDALLRHWRRTDTRYALEIAVDSFRAMARGGVYDQVGGGFHRYAVDAVWLVPHFEKMLYDNALLARLGVHLWQATSDPEIRRVTGETIDWVAREMTAPDGGFYATLDADSEGHEGKFYVWRAEELEALLGADAPLVMSYYGVTPTGNFEGQSILYVPFPPAAVAARGGVDEAVLEATVARARETLSAVRAKRVWPGRDDKIIAGWNGLMLRAVAEAARAFGRDDWRSMAVRNGEFLFESMVDADGRVLRSMRDGVAGSGGFLEDHAAVALGALALYELTFERRWLDRARRVADAMLERFWDGEANTFFDTPHDHEPLVTRPREVTDNAVPSGTSLAVELLLKLGDLFHDVEHRRRATWVLETLAEPMAKHPLAFGHLLGAADLAIHGAVELALVGEERDPALRALADEAGRRYVPSLVLAGGPPERHADIPLLADRPLIDGRPTAYVCRHYSCDEPTTEPSRLGEQLERAAAVQGAATG